MQFIKDIKENDRVVDHYLCRFKQALKTKAGKTYYSIKIQDKTGILDAKVWELTKDIQDFNEGDIIKIDANALRYQNEIQIKVNKLRRSQEGEYTPSDYVPTTKKDIPQMYARLTEIINNVENPHIKTLLQNIYNKHQDIIKSHSAAKSMHHSYMGGLLEHITAVTEICLFMAPRYENINQDLLVAGALLHDIGKIKELSPLPKNEYTDDGQMLGHIIIAIEMLAIEIAALPDFPHTLASLIKHLVISHHGEYNFGSPKLPSTMEAIILHFADNMDAKLATITEILEKDQTPGPWTGFQRPLDRYIRKSEF